MKLRMLLLMTAAVAVASAGQIPTGFAKMIKPECRNSVTVAPYDHITYSGTWTGLGLGSPIEGLLGSTASLDMQAAVPQGTTAIGLCVYSFGNVDGTVTVQAGEQEITTPLISDELINVIQVPAGGLYAKAVLKAGQNDLDLYGFFVVYR